MRITKPPSAVEIVNKQIHHPDQRVVISDHENAAPVWLFKDQPEAVELFVSVGNKVLPPPSNRVMRRSVRGSRSSKVAGSTRVWLPAA